MSRLALIKRRVEAAAGDADISWSDEVSASDNPVIAPTLPDEVGADDALGVLTARPSDEVSMDDAYTATTTVSKTLADDVSSDDAIVGRVDNIYVPRTASPNTDMQVDAWCNGLATVPPPSEQDINHGNESPLSVAGQNILASTRRGFLYYDLRRFAGCTAPTGGTMVLTVYTDQVVAVIQTTTFTFSVKAAQPFTESTVTWNTGMPTDGTSPVARTVSVPLRIDPLTPQFQPVSFTLTAAEYGPYLGTWMLVSMISDTLVATPVMVASREAATTSNRPRLSFAFKVP